ncbi:hypothetical protein P692DRAFT_201783252 [Suillus brevipes Sb2]|nr:hypothetical protein P692DRAFT_201783252 [Suillus brevipes Sb2]
MALLPLALAAILSLLCIPFVCASPPSLNGTTTSPSSSSHTRTLWNIIRSCAATLFACTWTAIHPNIPGMDEGKITTFSRRLAIMTMALIAPELMITWATIQFLSARDTAKTFNAAQVFNTQLHQTRNESTLLIESPTSGRTSSSHPSPPHVASGAFREWTVTHGFFAWMGGFMLYFNDKPRATLTPKELQRFVNEGSVEMPVIMEAEIEDRSKSDALSKGIAILQLAWFVLQLIARYIQNLPTTLLEIDTLAVAALTSIAYGLWWKKPKDVRRPHPVHWKETLHKPTKRTQKIQNSSLNDWQHLTGTRLTNSPRAVQKRRIPSVGGYQERDPHDRKHVITLLIGCLSATISGGMHCLGWNYMFQGHTNQTLWRTTSLATASAPLPILLISS